MPMSTLISFPQPQKEERERGMKCTIQGVGANNATVAHAAEQVPRLALQAKRTAGTVGAATTVPKVNPAAA